MQDLERSEKTKADRDPDTIILSFYTFRPVERKFCLSCPPTFLTALATVPMLNRLQVELEGFCRLLYIQFSGPLQLHPVHHDSQVLAMCRASLPLPGRSTLKRLL